MKRVALAAGAALFAYSPAAAQEAEPLSLVCEGVANYPVSSTSTANISTSYGESAYGSETTTARGSSREMLRLETDGAAGRIKPPMAMLPPLRGGDKDGWWKLADLDVSDDRISGKFSLNLINKPRVVIDRRTGDIDLKGFLLSFNGTCRRAPEEPTERKF